jgi:2-succinyl-6-hydroxy-2,4-cyclohexadiene-1-carboxylate synthase
MGGRIALAATLALADRRRVESLTLIAASPGIPSDIDRELRRASDAALADQLVRDGLEAFLRQWYQLPLFAGAVERHGIDAMIAARINGKPDALADVLRTGGAGAMPDLRAHLPRLQVPVLTLAGARDAKYVQLGEEIAAAVPRGRAAIIPDATHALLLEEGKRCGRIWCEFIETITTAQGDPS